MLALVFALWVGATPVQSDTEARKLATVAVARMGYATPDAEMKVRRARSAPDRPFWLVEWAGFRLEILDSGVLRYFKRESGAYRLSGAPTRYEDVESARVGLTRLAKSLGADPGANAEFVVWTRKDGRKPAQLAAGERGFRRAELAELSASLTRIGDDGTKRVRASIFVNAEDGVVNAYWLDPAFGIAGAKPLGG
ncbi:MAG: hypothetical protein KIS66_09710 [Fimbriimonadaceae bacterium]|nr:hypothetical protein [Fimbriimonadaceae bacterium]